MSVLAVPLAADSVASPRLVYGSLDLSSANGADQSYSAIYFEVAESGDLGRVTSLIAALETSLRLRRHEPGTLTALETYLHRRAQGMIGSLLWLIRSAAINAILDGTEKITKHALESIQADITSQNAPKKRL